MNTEYSINIGIRDALRRIPTKEYDDSGGVVGPNLDFDREWDDAQGKSFCRITCLDVASNQHTAVESSDGTDIEQLIHQAWDHLGKAIAKRTEQQWNQSQSKTGTPG